MAWVKLVNVRRTQKAMLVWCSFWLLLVLVSFPLRAPGQQKPKKPVIAGDVEGRSVMNVTSS